MPSFHCLPDANTLRKKSVHKCYSETISKIQSHIEGNFCYIVVDEITDVCGRFIANLLIGTYFVWKLLLLLSVNAQQEYPIKEQKSLAERRNSRGPELEPCGIPELIWTFSVKLSDPKIDYIIRWMRQKRRLSIW